MAQLAVRVLGTFDASLDDVPLTGFESDKARALLAYVAVESGRVHPRSTLTGLLWPDYPERRARQSLSQALSNVRAAIGDREAAGMDRLPGHPPFLNVTRQAIGLAADVDVWVDAVALERSVRELGDASLTPRSDRDLTSVVGHWEEVLALSRGEFLAGLSPSGCPAYEEWVLIQRERAEQSLLAVLGHLSACCSECGDDERALQYAWRELALARWREAAHRRVMRLLARTGQRNAALAQYQTCRQVLREELGVEPEPETRALAEALRSHSRPTVGAATDAVATTVGVPSRTGALPGIPHNLPAQPLPCVGRDREITEVARMLVDGPCRLVTLLGPGGIGKTRLALAAADRLIEDADGAAARFVDGVFLVSLLGVQRVDGFLPTVARALGLQGVGARPGSMLADPMDPLAKDQLFAYLRGRSVLLVLDNFEHLLGAVPVVIEMLAAAPALRLLVTTRARLNAMGECLYPVGSLSVPEETHLMPAATEGVPGPAVGPATCVSGVGGAMDLFRLGAGRLQPNLVWDAPMLEDVAAICRAVDGMPLGVLLAAGWTPVLSPAEIRKRVLAPAVGSDARSLRGVAVEARTLDLLATDWRDFPARHRNLRQVFAASWQMLSDRERAIFAALSIFRGSFTFERAQQVAGAGLFDLRSLIEKSLVARASVGRYQMHELLRQFAQEKLTRDPVVTLRVRTMHAETYAAALGQWGQAMTDPRCKDALAEMDHEIDNAREAWDWLVAQGDAAAIEGAIDGLGRYYSRRSRYEEGRSVTAAALDALTAPGRDGSETADAAAAAIFLRARMRVTAWWAEFRPLEEARPVLKAALTEIADGVAGVDLRPEQAALLLALGHTMRTRFDAEMLTTYTRAQDLAREVGDRWLEAQAEVALGAALWAMGRSTEAVAAHRRALDTADGLGDLWTIADIRRDLSGMVSFMGRYEEGLAHARAALAIYEELGDRASVAASLNSLAVKVFLLGRHDEALAYSQEGQQLRCMLGLQNNTADAILVWLLVSHGLYDRARSLADAVVRASREEGNRWALGWALLSAGALALAEGDLAGADSLVGESVFQYRTIGNHLFLPFVLAVGAVVSHRRQRDGEAYARLQESWASGAGSGNLTIASMACLAMALLLAELGHCEQAVATVVTVARFSAWVTMSQWCRDVVWQPIVARCPCQAPSELPARVASLEARAAVKAAGDAALATLGEALGYTPSPQH